MEIPASGSLRSNRNPLFSWSILGALIFFVIWWKLGYPSPSWDDLFYIGAGLNMAGGGDFSNPLLVRQNFPSHYFFVYPPLHSYALYWWLSVFGTSAASVLAFQNFVYFIIAAAMILIMRRLGARQTMAWLVPFSISAVFSKTGLRPEAFAIAVTMSGYALLIYRSRIDFPMCLAFFLIFSGTLAAPRTAFFGVAFVLLAAWQWLKHPPDGGPVRLRFCLIAGIALVAASLLFLVLIHFRPFEFLRTFHLHSTRLSADLFTLLGREFRQFGARLLPIFFLALLLLFLALRHHVGKAGPVCYCMAITFFIAGIGKAFGPGSSWYLFFIIFLLISALAERLRRSQMLALEVALAFVLLIANSSRLLEQYGILTGKIQCLPIANREAILAMKSTPEHPLLIDNGVARVFDYRIPPGYLDFGFSAPFPGFFDTPDHMHPEDIYILGVGKIIVLNSVLHANFPIEYWSPFSVSSHDYVKYPCQIFILPAAKCIEIRDENAAYKK
jgi:hypothetical protein